MTDPRIYRSYAGLAGALCWMAFSSCLLILAIQQEAHLHSNFSEYIANRGILEPIMGFSLYAFFMYLGGTVDTKVEITDDWIASCSLFVNKKVMWSSVSQISFLKIRQYASRVAYLKDGNNKCLVKIVLSLFNDALVRDMDEMIQKHGIRADDKSSYV